MRKTVGYTILGAGALLVLIGILSKKQGATGNNAQDNNSEGGKVSFTAMEFVAMADAVYNAKGMVNDDEEAIYRVFESLQNRADLLQLILVFGERRFFKYGSDMNLTAWVKDTLSTTEQVRVKAVYDKFNVPF